MHVCSLRFGQQQLLVGASCQEEGAVSECRSVRSGLVKIISLCKQGFLQIAAAHSTRPALNLQPPDCATQPVPSTTMWRACQRTTHARLPTMNLAPTRTAHDAQHVALTYPANCPRLHPQNRYPCTHKVYPDTANPNTCLNYARGLCEGNSGITTRWHIVCHVLLNKCDTRSVSTLTHTREHG